MSRDDAITVTVEQFEELVENKNFALLICLVRFLVDYWFELLRHLFGLMGFLCLFIQAISHRHLAHAPFGGLVDSWMIQLLVFLVLPIFLL